MGNVSATVIEGIASAFATAIEAGADFNRSLEEVNGTLHTTTQMEDDLSGNFGAFSGAILEQTGAWDSYRFAIDVLNTNLEYLTELIGGVTAKELEQAEIRKRIAKDRLKEMEEETKAWAKHDAWVQREREKSHRADMKRKKEAYDADVKQQKNLSRIEAIVAKENEAKLAKMKEIEAQYEAELVAVDAYVDAVNEETQSIIDNSQATDENTNRTNNNTEATDRNTSSTVANTRASEANTQVNGQNYSRNEMDNRNDPNGAYQNNHASIQLEDIARNTRQTNQYLRGD